MQYLHWFLWNFISKHDLVSCCIAPKKVPFKEKPDEPTKHKTQQLKLFKNILDGGWIISFCIENFPALTRWLTNHRWNRVSSQPLVYLSLGFFFFDTATSLINQREKVYYLCKIRVIRFLMAARCTLKRSRQSLF